MVGPEGHSGVNDWGGRRVLVTGATGFLGTALTRELIARGAQVVRLMRVDAARGALAPDDLMLPLDDADALAGALAARSIDSLFHLAAISMPERAAADPAGTFAVNVGGTIAVLEAARRSGAIERAVFASSCRVYGPGDRPKAEDAPLAGTSVYDCSKIAAEAACRAYAADFALPIGIVRCGNLFGPADPQRDRIVPATIDALLAGRRPIVLSDGTAERDYVHIDDAVDACLRLAECVGAPGFAGEAFNIGSGESLSIVELVRRLAAAAGRPDLHPDIRASRSDRTTRLALVTARARERLGWQPAAPLADRLLATVEAERKRRGGIAGATSAPRVFVGIPTINRPEFVREAIASIAAQGLTDVRVVVSDNGSPPAIRDDIAAYVAGLSDPRFSFVAQPVNQGEYGQGRFLFAEAQRSGAAYFMILHDDDLVAPHLLERAIAQLDATPGYALFVGDAELIDEKGDHHPDRTRTHRIEHGRTRHPGGAFDILREHLAHGFTSISATVFRVADLTAAGLTDPDLTGNYPFECNVMVRLGDRGAQGFFAREPLYKLRFHSGSMRVYARLIDNPQMVRTTLRLFERRRYAGANERRRRVLVSRLRRADALLRLRDGDLTGCRAALVDACAANPLSPKAWMCRAVARVAPARLCASLPTTSHAFAPEAPRLATERLASR